MSDQKTNSTLIAIGILLAAGALVAQYLTEKKSTLGVVVLVVGLVALALLAYGVWIRRGQ